MSQENVEAVRAVYEEWAKGNFRAGGDLWDRRVVFVPVAELPDAGDYFGLEGVTTFMRAFLQPWTNFTITAEELIEGGDSVVVVARQRGVGRESGLVAELEQQFQVWTFRGRTVIRFEAFRGRAEALEAVGLREQAMSRENAEALRRAVAAASENDPAPFVALLDVDVDWESRNSTAPPDLLGAYHGVDGVLQYFTRWEQAWLDWDSEFEEIEPVESHVISHVHIWGQGRRTGIKADWRMWQAWTFREGKVIRYRDFDTKREALEAVGCGSR